jgi:hypothetical protein
MGSVIFGIFWISNLDWLPPPARPLHWPSGQERAWGIVTMAPYLLTFQKGDPACRDERIG